MNNQTHDSPTDHDDDGPHMVWVHGLVACLKNKAAIKAMLEPIPDAEQIRFLIKGGCTAQQWEPNMQVDFWVISNGRKVLRLCIGGLDMEEAGECRRIFAERRSRTVDGIGRVEWLDDILREVTNSPPLAQSAR